MRIPLIKIGNSKGIRIPSALIKKCGFTQEVDIDVKNHNAPKCKSDYSYFAGGGL